MYTTLYAHCIRCKKLFMSNPDLVPTIRLTPESEKEPLCKTCYEFLREFQKKLGLLIWPEMPDQAWGLGQEYDWEADLYGEYDPDNLYSPSPSDKPNTFVNRESDKQEYDPYEPF